MVHDAEVPPADPQKEGRGGLKDYNEKGYVTLADERSGSRTAEYSYDDFAISEVACGLGKEKEAALYASRAHNFEHLWDKDMTVEGFKGFMRPRNADGTWAPPYLVVRGTWPDFFYEGDIWTYSIYAPQDMRRLIEMAGGDQMFVNRLDWTFLRRHFDVTNEPGFLIPVLYNYAGRPDKSADIVHLLLEKYFMDNRAGIPGNDDSGAMSSWLIFSTLGIFPVAGQDVYLISTPSIPDASLYSRQRQKTSHHCKEPRPQRSQSLRAVGNAERSRICQPHGSATDKSKTVRPWCSPWVQLRRAGAKPCRRLR